MARLLIFTLFDLPFAWVMADQIQGWILFISNMILPANPIDFIRLLALLPLFNCPDFGS